MAQQEFMRLLRTILDATQQERGSIKRNKVLLRYLGVGRGDVFYPGDTNTVQGPGEVVYPLTFDYNGSGGVASVLDWSLLRRNPAAGMDPIGPGVVFG